MPCCPCSVSHLRCRFCAYFESAQAKILITILILHSSQLVSSLPPSDIFLLFHHCQTLSFSLSLGNGILIVFPSISPSLQWILRASFEFIVVYKLTRQLKRDEKIKARFCVRQNSSIIVHLPFRNKEKKGLMS